MTNTRNKAVRRRLDRTLAGALLVSVLGMTGAAIAAPREPDPEILKLQMEALEDEIAKYRQALDQYEGRKSEVERNLETNERLINTLLNKIRDIETAIKRGAEKLRRLGQQQRDLQQKSEAQQAMIERQLVAAYKMGEQEYLKVLLNQEDPNELARMLKFYDYFNRARTDQIAAYRTTIAELDAVAQSIIEENRNLDANRTELDGQKAELLSARKEKETTLASLTREIADTGTRIERLKSDREDLEGLLREIERRLARLPSPDDAVPFATLKGRMPMPVVGRVGQKFGAARVEGRLNWNGVLIEAPEGTAVKAIHYGHVVFSDWLRGFGLLMIINHGDGYMSLYGHNQVLYREAGDWVTAGETIGTVGNSGGQGRPALYFEIRVAGKPADPQLWCRAGEDNAA